MRGKEYRDGDAVSDGGSLAARGHRAGPRVRDARAMAAWAGLRRSLAICLSLAGATAATLHPVLVGGFVLLDDPFYITQNPRVRAGLSAANLLWAFRGTPTSNWHPLTWLSHMADCQLFGLNPALHHLTSLVLHCASALILFLLLERATEAAGRSVFVAALFAVHPLHVESVAWTSERKDVLSGLLGLLTIAAYLAWGRGSSAARRPVAASAGRSEAHNRLPSAVWSDGRFLLALGFFALGLLAKPMLVTLPLIFLLLDIWPVRRVSLEGRGVPALWPLALEKAPFFTLSAASSIVTFLVQREGGAMATLGEYPLPLRLSNALVAYVLYLGKTLWPLRLSAFYPMPSELPWWQPAAATLLLAALTVLAMRWWRSRPYLLVGWLWYLGMLVPVIGIVQVGEQAMADRYTYLPLIGLFIVTAWGTGDLIESLRLPRGAAPALAACALVPLGVLASMQARYWRDDASLFTHAPDMDPCNWPAHLMIC